MNRAEKKTLSILLYVTYSIILTCIITFGSGLEVALMQGLKGFLTAIVHPTEIEDVVMDLDVEEPFVVGRYYNPKYTIIGRTSGDAGLRFKALDNTIKSVGNLNGSFYGASTDAEQTTGRLEITSLYDRDFRKVITLHFTKKYPTKVVANYMVKSMGANVKKAYMGIPIYPYYHVKDGEIYSEKEFEILYDKNYFQEIEKGVFLPIKETLEGGTVGFTYRFANGATFNTQEFSILPAVEASSIDEIYFGQNEVDGLRIKRNSAFFLTMKKEGERVYSNYQLTFSNPDGAKILYTGYLQFTSLGEQTITIRLPNGFEKRIEVYVYDEIKFPEVTPVNKQNAQGMYECKKGESVVFNYQFEKGMTYTTLQFEYDNTMVTLQRGNNTFSIKGKSVGTTQVKMILDNGVERYEKVFSIKVLPNYGISALENVDMGLVVGKGIGHFALFMVLAFFAVYMSIYMDFKEPLPLFAFLLLCGLGVALLTEGIQFFFPLRMPSMGDIIVDMGGFLFGILLASFPVFVGLNKYRN